MYRDLHLPAPSVRPPTSSALLVLRLRTYPSIMEYALGQDSFVVTYNVMPKNENVLVLCLNSNVKPGKRPNQTTSKRMPLFIASCYHYHYHLISGMKIDVAKSNFLATLPF